MAKDLIIDNISGSQITVANKLWAVDEVSSVFTKGVSLQDLFADSSIAHALDVCIIRVNDGYGDVTSVPEVMALIAKLCNGVS